MKPNGDQSDSRTQRPQHKGRRPAPAVAHSISAFEAAQKVLVGGVNSPVRAFRAVGGVPRFIRKAEGAMLTDVDGNEYIDYVGAWGPMILGHRDRRATAAASGALGEGWSFGAPTEKETALARRIIEDVPSIEVIRFVSSGTEATMSAIRLARGVTGRDLIVKCEGCYHGHADALLVEAGSGATTFGAPSSAGVPSAMTAATLLAPYNDLEAARSIFAQHGRSIAALILEPVAGNMGCVPPMNGYLAGLRALCDEHGSLLIFDEVMTGYRVALGGAQERYGVRPDVTCLGKIIGGGLPVGAYGASRDIMAQLSPLGPVYQAGTLSGNPLAMAVGLATLEALHEPGSYERLEALSAQLASGLSAAARRTGVTICQNRVGSMGTLFFQAGPVTDYASAKRSDVSLFGRYFQLMLEQGVYLPPSQFEATFISLAHTEEHIGRTIAAAERALDVLAGEAR